MTPAERQEHMLKMLELREKSNPEVHETMLMDIYLNWSWPGRGFGQLSVYKNEQGQLVCDNECMSRDSVRKILVALANKIADEAILDCGNEDSPPKTSA